MASAAAPPASRHLALLDRPNPQHSLMSALCPAPPSPRPSRPSVVSEAWSRARRPVALSVIDAAVVSGRLQLVPRTAPRMQPLCLSVIYDDEVWQEAVRQEGRPVQPASVG